MSSEWQSAYTEHYKVILGLACLWLAFILNEVLKGYYFNSGNVSIGYYTLFGLYLYLPWFLFSIFLLHLAKSTLHHSLFCKSSLATHLPISFFWGGIHVVLLTSAYWIFWPERVTQVNVSFVLVEQALKWFHFEILAYFILLSVWRRVLLKPSQIHARKSSSDGNGTLSLVTDTGIVMLHADDIDWLLADDNYVIVHADRRKIRVRGTMKDMLKQLHHDQFQQTHRSAIVNMSKVQEIGSHRLTMQSGSRVPVSRRRHRDLVAAFTR